jgi:hypothetical protein
LYQARQERNSGAKFRPADPLLQHLTIIMPNEPMDTYNETRVFETTHFLQSPYPYTSGKSMAA